MNKQKAKAKLKDQWAKTQEQHFGKEKTVEKPTYERCFHGHPGLPLGEFMIYGGSASTPKVKDADIYVALDRGSYDNPTYPWHDGPISILFRVTDMDIPEDKAEFANMVEWLSEQIKAGKKVHIGCFGGHGRTGMLLAAIVAHMGVSDDPIAYVRKHYCHKAVESQKQVEFLVQHWGAKPAKPSKAPVWKTQTDHTVEHHGWATGGPTGAVSWFKGDKLTPVDSGPPQPQTFSVWAKTVNWVSKDKS